MKKTLITFLSLVMLFIVVFSSAALAADEQPITPDAYWEGWKVYSTSYVGISYGSWRIGPSGWGPGSVTLQNSYTVSNSVSGQIEVSYSAITSAVGYDVTASYSELASYTVNPPYNEKWEILFREKKYKDLVTQRSYIHIDGQDIWGSDYAYAYAYEFASWDYDYRVIDYR